MDWGKKSVAWANNQLPVLKTKHLHRVRLYLTSPLPEAYQIVAVHNKQVVAFLSFRNDKEALRIVESSVKPAWPQPNLIDTITKWAGELTGGV